MFKCYQWLIRDNQQTCFPYFIITKKHYTNLEDVSREWSPQNTEYCYRPIRAIEESRLEGELAERIYGNERK